MKFGSRKARWMAEASKVTIGKEFISKLTPSTVQNQVTEKGFLWKIRRFEQRIRSWLRRSHYVKPTTWACTSGLGKVSLQKEFTLKLPVVQNQVKNKKEKQSIRS